MSKVWWEQIPNDGRFSGTDRGLPLSGVNLEKSADIILLGLEYVSGIMPFFSSFFTM